MTILIKNIQLIDGSGRPAVKADVLIKKDRIAAIGGFSRYKADEIIDGMGAYLSPGFIDINTDSDHYLTIFSNPAQKSFLLQGATTIVGGHCGISLAPLLYGSLESIWEWADIYQININWHSAAEFLKIMEKKSLGVNFATLIGHTTIRQDLTWEEARDLTKNELLIFKSIAERSIKEGAFGLSFGLGYSATQNTSYGEVAALISIMAQLRALTTVHLRNEKEKILTAIKEVIDLAKETGAKIIISHLRPFIGYEKDYEEGFKLINDNISQADIYFDVSPFNISVMPAYMLLPSWVKSEEKEKILKNLRDPAIKIKIIKELPKLRGEEIIIVKTPAHYQYLKGKTLKEFAQNRGLTLGKALLTLMDITNLRTIIFYKNINLTETIKSLVHERAIIASNSASFKDDEDAIRPERTYKTFPRLLELAEKEKIMPIETAIFKITGLPAKILGLSRRGIIKVGNYADLTIFRDAQIKEVIVNGRRTVKDGEFQNVLAGRVLRRVV